jgi:hypothetical protein
VTEATVLDHVGLVGRDIGTMISAVRRLGFSPTMPQPLMSRDAATGALVSLHQTSAHLVLESGYVELSAVHTDSPSHHLAGYLGRYQGLHILAFGVEDIAAAHSRCASCGLRPGPVSHASRYIAYGDRHGEARFEWFMLEPACSPEGLVCFVRQVTPGLVFQPAVQRHPNGALGLEGVYLATSDPSGLARRLAASTEGACLATPHGARVELPVGWLECCRSDVLARRFPGSGLPAEPCMAGISLRVGDLQAARGLAGSAGLATHSCPGGFWVAAGDAAGCLFAFAGAAPPN